MTIDEIIDIERGNNCEIHLFRNGLFYRAFERSALAFLDVENYQIIKKHSVKLNLDYIYVGFPASILDRVLEARQYRKIADDHIVVTARKISDEELEIKKSGYQIAETRSVKLIPQPSVVPSPVVAPEVVADIETIPTDRVSDKIDKSDKVDKIDKVVSQTEALVAAFDVDNSTPVMCQTFLLMLQEKIRLSSLT